MTWWMWLLVGLWVGFIAGVFTVCMCRMASGGGRAEGVANSPPNTLHPTPSPEAQCD
jgi:hypothetical protein